MTEYGKWRSLIDGAGVIPDSDVYLQDDWGDNKIQNRDGGGTTAYNGVTGYYRPEWVIDSGSPAASNQQLDISGGDALHTEINLALSNTIAWAFTSWNISSGGNGAGDQLVATIYSESTTLNGARYNESYALSRRRSDDLINLEVVDGSGSVSAIIESSGHPEDSDVTVTRSSSGQWELIVNGTSQGTTTNTDFTSPQYAAFSATASAAMTLNELKVN